MAGFSLMISNIKKQLLEHPRVWLVTGVAGFIGSNLLEALLNLGQTVVGLDNFATGHRHNLEDVKNQVGKDAWKKFVFIEGDIRNLEDCRKAMKCSPSTLVGAGRGEGVTVDYVLHQAALGSVPMSIGDPIRTNQSNIDGFLNMLVAARDAKVKRFVYAASSSTYGDHAGLPKKEEIIGRPLSPYAVTKYVNELYADVFSRTYGIECIGLRYFNVFGRRQDPSGDYAAVIPRWIGEMLSGMALTIHGDGETSRDFCYVTNAVQANILAAMTENKNAVNKVFNIAVGDRTTLNELFHMIKYFIGETDSRAKAKEPIYGHSRSGDVRHSQADISKAKELLGFNPSHTVKKGMKETVEWFANLDYSCRIANNPPAGPSLSRSGGTTRG